MVTPEPKVRMCDEFWHGTGCWFWVSCSGWGLAWWEPEVEFPNLGWRREVFVLPGVIVL
jgi:hypothetical protein